MVNTATPQARGMPRGDFGVSVEGGVGEVQRLAR